MNKNSFDDKKAGITMTTNTKIKAIQKTEKHTVLIQKDPLTPPKHVKPPFSRQLWWWMGMIECGKALSDNALDAKKRTEIYEHFLTVNEEVYEGFYDKNLIWNQLDTAFKATEAGMNNLYNKLSEQDGDFYTLSL